MITEKELRENKELLQEAKKLYKLRFKTDFVESCRNCFLDLLSIINYYKKNPLQMEKLKECQFHIKDSIGGAFRIFGSDEYFSNATLTDEQCFAFIAKNKKHIGYFDKFPDNFDVAKPAELIPDENAVKTLVIKTDLKSDISIDDVKKELDKKGIKYHRNAGYNKLVKLLADENI